MTEEQPEYLYKFRSLDGDSADFTRQIIEDAKLWYSRPLDFNDPFDCSPAASPADTEGELKKYLSRVYRKESGLPRKERRRIISEHMKEPRFSQGSGYFQKSLTEVIGKAVNSAGVLSLSARYDHVLMWSHYASSHRGICLRFRSDGGSSFCKAQKVLYSPERPILNVLRDNQNEQLEKALLTKADYWSYEEEWRIIDPVRKSGAHPYPREELDGVIFGARTPPGHKDQVIRWLADRRGDVELLEASFDPARFRLVIR
jgi:hypothetical protein